VLRPPDFREWLGDLIRKIHERDWHPMHIIDINASPVSATLQPAGLEASMGVISVRA
jgi:branched-chain amino acid transport system substrate-binding protein